MKHIATVTRVTPAVAASPVEVAGMFAKISTTFSTLTSGVNFYNLIANPPSEIANGQKGIGGGEA